MAAEFDSRTHLRAADGSLVTFRSSTLLFGGESSFSVNYVDRGTIREIRTGARDYAMASAQGIQGVEVVERFTLKGWPLRIGRALFIDDDLEEPEHIVCGAWEADNGSVAVTIHTADETPSSEIIGALDPFDLEDTKEGPVLIDPGSLMQLDTTSAATVVPGFGLVAVERHTKDVARSLPRWRGTEVRGGELFAMDGGSDRRHRLLIGESAVSTIMPADDIPGDVLVRGLADLEVSWASG